MKTQLHQYLFLLLIMPIAFACDNVKGSGNVVKENREVAPFTRLEISGSFDVYVTQEEGNTVTIEAEDNIIPLIETIDEDDRLKIRFKNNVNIRNHSDIKVYVPAKVLETVSQSGSGDVKITGIFSSPNTVHLNLSGSGDLKGMFNAPEVNINLAGSGDIEVKGETRDLGVSIAGSGNADVDELLAENANINIAGSGDVKIHASRNLKASILGSGNVYYKGDPTVNVSNMGSGNVRKQ